MSKSKVKKNRRTIRRSRRTQKRSRRRTRTRSRRRSRKGSKSISIKTNKTSDCRMNIILDIDDPDYESDESGVQLKMHKVRERDQELVDKAKNNFVNKHGALFCEVCGFNFLPFYGFSYAEAHHKKPLHQIMAGQKTKVSDLAIVCANCHKAVHRIISDDPWSELIKINKKFKWELRKK